MLTVKVDALVIGGGIAGLWTLARLKQTGYRAMLIEGYCLGGQQTIHSQGIIHSGLKYALNGYLTKAATAIANMPKYWEDCLQGTGEIDLQTVLKTSNFQYLWSTESITSQLSTFFGSLTLKSSVKKVYGNERPSVFQAPSFKGTCYRLNEPVLNIPTLITSLANQTSGLLWKVDPIKKDAIEINSDRSIRRILVKSADQMIALEAKAYIFTCGEENDGLISKITDAPVMQLRPLHMTYVKLTEYHPLFAHCIGASLTPRITITTHQTKNNNCIWYLGGQLAESGILRTEAEQINFAKKELSLLFPHINFSNAIWGSFRINRAEGIQPTFKRPDIPIITTKQNATIAWPTKLAFAPELANLVLKDIHKKNIQPSSPMDLSFVPQVPAVAEPIWEKD